MKRLKKGGRVIYKGQPLRVIVTLGDGLVFENADTISVEIFAASAPGTKKTASAVKTSDNTAEAAFNASDMGAFVKGEMSGSVTISTAEGDAVSSHPIGEMEEGAGISTQETRVAIPIYVRDVAPLSIPVAP